MRPSRLAAILGATTPAAPSGTLRIVGDSIANGLSAATTAEQWAQRLQLSINRATLAGSPTNGSQVTQHTTTQTFAQTAMASGDTWAWLSGYNDMRLYGSDATKRGYYATALRAGVAWMARPNAAIFQGSAGGWAYTGSWSSFSLFSLSTRFTSTVGDKATISVTGTAVTVCYMQRQGLGDGAVMTVKIDGATVGTIDTSVGQLDTGFDPRAVRFAGLSSGAHTVELIHAGAAGKVMQICFVAGSGTPGPEVRVLGCLKMPTAGYSQGSPFINGSDAAAMAYAAEVATVCAEAKADGLDVRTADVNAYYSTANIHSDLIHPNSAGHAQIAAAFAAAT